MNNQQRLDALVDQLQALHGVNEELFRRLGKEIERSTTAFGHDEQGRLKIAFYDAQTYDIHSFENCNNNRFACHFISAALDADTANAADGFKVVCIFVNDRCDRQIVESLASLGVELIALRCSGYNNVDIEACAEHGISVVRVPAYSPNAVAEHTVALMLMLNRKLHQAYVRNRTGYFVLSGLTGFDMKGKTVGVVGTGKIGQCLIDILLGFGCHVLAYDKFENPAYAAKDGVDYVDLPTLYRRSHIISLHVPLFEETHHMIDASAIEQMQEGVMIINTSRGGLIDTRALIAGLKSKRIGAAGLDVYEEEAGIFFRDMSDEVLTDDVLARLMTFHNVVVTSHQAFLTREALTNIANTTLGSIEEFSGGKRGADLSNAVTGR